MQIEEPIADLSVLEIYFNNQRQQALNQRAEPIRNRKDRLTKLLKWIQSHEQDIKNALFQDFKKPESEVDLSEIYPSVSEIRHAISHLSDWCAPKKVDAPLSLLGTTSYIKYEPKGRCLIISPWNFPFNLAVCPLVSCLAAGNTAIIKPSEMTPHTAQLIAKMVSEVFTPEEVTVAIGGVEVSQALLKLPFDHIFFTGSPQVGKIVMAAAAQNLTSVTLELGGKSPVIIDQTANIKDAAEKLSWGKFLNSGQTCIAPDYILIAASKKEEFIEALKAQINKQFNNTGAGFAHSPDYGRIVNEHHFKRLNSLLEEVVDKGASVRLSGETKADENFISPFILDEVDMHSRVMQEEIFGPVLPIITFNEIEEAIQLVNSKPKPLALYYFGRSRQNKKMILQQTSSGSATINDCVIHFGHSNLPFGGVNNSGMGKSHGRFGFLSFSNEKGVLQQRVGLTSSKFIYPPYNKLVKTVFSLLKKFF